MLVFRGTIKLKDNRGEPVFLLNYLFIHILALYLHLRRETIVCFVMHQFQIVLLTFRIISIKCILLYIHSLF